MADADNTPKQRHFSSRKFLAFIMTSIFLIFGALAVKNGNYGALSVGLVAIGAAFITGNTVSGVFAGNANTTVNVKADTKVDAD